MRIVYVDCPKCDDEFEFGVTREYDGTLQIEEETQNCECVFDEDEKEEIHDWAFILCQ